MFLTAKKLLAWTVLLAPIATFAGVEISELMAKNETVLATASGEYEDWIEIHNDSGTAVDLAGWYLTDDPADLRKWQFPSTPATSPLADDGYLVLFADDSDDAVIGSELHVSFKLSASGEYLALVEPDGETVAFQYAPAYPAQSADVSYGIDPATGQHTFFASSTPGTANGQAIADRVEFSKDSRAFSSAFTLTLSAASPTASIRYTLDGSIPTATSSLYGAGIFITTTTQVRARAFDTGLADGPVVSKSYYHLDAGVAAFSSELPLVVIDNFGGGEIPDNTGSIRQPSQFMIFEPVDGVTTLTNPPVISSRAGIRRRGESTLRDTEDKPNLSVETWSETDEDAQSIKPFGMPAESDWILFAPLRFDPALMRNSFIYEVSNETGRYAVRTQFVEVFLNADGGSLTTSNYYGVYVFMEKIKQDSGRVDVSDLPDTADAEPEISGGYIWKLDKTDGGTQKFTVDGKTLTGVYPKDMPSTQLNWLKDHLEQAVAATENGTYASYIDVESFADHHIFTVFANNADGLIFSTFYHKERDGLIQMGPAWDFDRSMGCETDPTDRPTDPEVWSHYGDEDNNLQFFRKEDRILFFPYLALNDPDFWMVWVDRWHFMRKGPLSESAIIERIEGYRSLLSNAAIRNFDRWDHLTQHLVISSSEWTGKVDLFKNHVLTRGQWIDDQLIDPPVFSHTGGWVAPGFQLSMTGPHTQYFTLDGSDPRASGGAAAGAAYASPITITTNTRVKARAGSGEVFTDAPTTWPWSALTEALFVVEPAPLAITELMYHPRPPEGAAEIGFTASDFEFIEIHNTGTAVCSLVGVELLDGVQFDFYENGSVSLGAGEYGVVVRNLDAFKARYTNWAGLNMLGVFEGRLSDGSENIELGYDLTNMVALASFDYEDDWYPCTDGEGFSLVLRDPQSDPAAWDSKAAWRHSAGRDGSPGMPDPAPLYAPGSVVINEVLSHQDTDNPGDWIELHNTTDAAIDIGGWYLSDSRGNLEKYTIPGGTIIPTNGYVLLTEYDHFGSVFALSEHGDSVYLSAGSGGTLSEPAYRETVSFGGQERDITFGRHLRTDGSAVFPSLSTATPGAANSAPRVGPVVIEEFMYHPAVGGYEYIKLRNTSGTAVDLFDPAHPANVWKVSGIDFEFPSDTTLAPDEFVLLVRDTVSPGLFRQIYQVPISVQIFSYSGALDNDADTIKLRKPGTPEAATGYVPYIVVEQVKYNDSAPWPLDSDGGGQGLRRIDSGLYANDYANWQAVITDYAPVLYSLSVYSGSGTGSYSPGTVVPVRADVLVDQEFSYWAGHQAGLSAVDLASVTVTMPTQDTTITAIYGSKLNSYISLTDSWKYHDLGLDLGTAWREAGYDDTAWAMGAAQLGYGGNGETTTVSFGTDEDNKHPTTYFRKSFSVNDASVVGSLKLGLVRDDGAVVYINGVEVVRDNMPTGSVSYATLASATVGGSSESTPYWFDLDPAVLVDGINWVAAEVHQKALTSSDLSFAIHLEGVEEINIDVVDGDADGMYDGWETNFFGSTESGLPTADPDGDGFWNVDEFVAGTLPDDGNSFFAVRMINIPDITWAAVSGRVYTLYWTDDLMESFVPIGVGISEGGYTDTGHTNSVQNFYRVNVELAPLP